MCWCPTSGMLEEDHSNRKSPMDDFLDRVVHCERKLSDTTLPLATRVPQAMQIWSGIRTDPLPGKLQRHIDRRIAAINRVLRRYPIKTIEDYRMISTEDLNALASELRKML